MKLSYQKCEQSGCARQGVVFVRSSNDIYIVVCKECADKKKQPVGAKQGKLV